MSNPPSAYEKLSEAAAEIHLLNQTAALVSWDQETCMPPQGVEFRARQSAWLHGKSHELATTPQRGDWIAECEASDLNPDSDEALSVREWRYHYDRDTKLPTALVEEFEEKRALAHAAWAEAREQSDFSLFQSHLETILDLTRQKAECWGYEEHIYDALLENYERGARRTQLQALFDDLQPELVEVVGAALSQPPRVAPDLLEGSFPIPQQQAFNEQVARQIGFDFEAGRIDTAVHPFCTTLGPRDIRLTTRYDEKDFASSLYGVLHETGHGLYEQGVALTHTNAASPLAQAVSLGIHESQSRLWENQVGRSRAFWERWLPTAKGTFSGLEAVTLDEMALAVNRAQRSFIRVEADEVTYDLHIILRFRIEQALISGDLAVADLPDAWNSLFRELFSMEVGKDSNGCLQDVHWSFGLLGYFPTYSLGNINAAQLYRAAMQDSAVAEGVEKAEYAALLEWLRTNVHSAGSRLSPNELIQQATGESPRADYLIAHLKDRYLA